MSLPGGSRPMALTPLCQRINYNAKGGPSALPRYHLENLVPFQVQIFYLAGSA